MNLAVDGRAVNVDFVKPPSCASSVWGMTNAASVGAQERHRKIEALLAGDGSVRIASVARELQVSEMTVRRDLADLERAGVLRRVRGGATKSAGPQPFSERRARHQAAKARIAQKALHFLPERGAIALDASTTSGAFAATLSASSDLTVMTNSWENFDALRRAGVSGAVLTGGEADGETDSLVGAVACRSASAFHYETFFASASSLDATVGASDVSLAEVQVKEEFARVSARLVLLADTSKLGQRDVVKSFEWEAVSALITELPPEDERLDGFREVVELH